MEYLILALVIFLVTRYGIKILDSFFELVNIFITDKINNINIIMAKNTHEFEKSCEDEIAKKESAIGFMYPKESEEFYDEDDDD